MCFFFSFAENEGSLKTQISPKNTKPQTSDKNTKQKTKQNIRERLGRGTLNTCANFPGLRPMTKETRCSKDIFPNYPKKTAEDTLVPPLWGTREKNVELF